MNKKIKKVGIVAGIVTLMGASFIGGKAVGEGKENKVVMTKMAIESLYHATNYDCYRDCNEFEITQLESERNVVSYRGIDK